MVVQRLIILTVTTQLIIFTRVQATQAANCNTTCTYEEVIQDVVCENLALTNVPQGCSPSMQMMSLRNNHLQVLGPGNFRGYRQLESLDLGFNEILTINKGAFEGCVSLAKIYLQSNLLEVVEEGAFEGATVLYGLYLNDNNIRSLHADAFHGLGNLKYLDVGNNALQTLPERIFDNLVRLTFLGLGNNNLQSINGALFTNLANLEKLILSGNSITSISSFPKLPSLSRLDLSDNDLRDISDLVGKINNLDRLDLAENDNIICTCSIYPICSWIKNHRSDRDAGRVDVTCHEPLHLRGQMLHSLSNSSLCSKLTPGSELSLSTSTDSHPAGSTTSTLLTKYEVEERSGQQTASNGYSKPLAIGIYVAVGSGCLIGIILTLIVLTKYLNYRSRKRRQQLQVTMQEQRQPPPQRNHEAPVMRITINRSTQGEDGYEAVQPNFPNSPMNDSAFGSQPDLAGISEDAQVWQDVTYQDVHNSSESSFQSCPTYMSLDDWEVTHPLPPLDVSTDEDLPPLAQEQQPTNPLLRNVPQDQAIPISEKVSNEKHFTYYVPHTVISKLPSATGQRHTTPKIPKPVYQVRSGLARKLPQSLQDNPKHNTPYVPHSFVCQLNPTPGQSPDQTPEHSRRHVALSESINPFLKSTGSNPFVSCQ